VNALAPKVIERIDLDEDFSDVSGTPGSEFTLHTADGQIIPPEGDAEYHYCFVDKNDREFGLSFMKRNIPGYEVVTAEKGGVTIRGMEFAAGETIESRDQVLMRCNRAKWEKLQRYQVNKHEIENRKMQRRGEGTVDLDRDMYAGRRERAKYDSIGA
jgi:hypothetical protein